MKFVVERRVHGIVDYDVVEADTPVSAMLSSGTPDFSQAIFDETSNNEDSQDVEIVGVYEVGQINLAESLGHNMNIHSYYRQRITDIGFNPDNFEPLNKEDKQ